jgi:hypothetical protein
VLAAGRRPSPVGPAHRAHVTQSGLGDDLGPTDCRRGSDGRRAAKLAPADTRTHARRRRHARPRGEPASPFLRADIWLGHPSRRVGQRVGPQPPPNALTKARPIELNVMNGDKSLFDARMCAHAIRPLGLGPPTGSIECWRAIARQIGLGLKMH